jgi:hypothetical protein
MNKQLDILKTVAKQYEAQIAKHKLNIEILLNNPTSIPEHSDFIAEIDKELSSLAEAKDKLECLTDQFRDF